MLPKCGVGAVAFLTCLLSGIAGLAAQDAGPATAAQAAAVLDLSTWPLIDPVNRANTQVVAAQSYLAKGGVPGVAGKCQAALKAAGWTEMAGASITDGYASASFQKSGFSISLTVMPGNETGTSDVSIINHGNVNLKTVPVPKSAQEIFALPMSIMYVADLPVADAVGECRKLLAEQGWVPFGETTVSFYVKKNAARLQVMVSEAPAQNGKTSIQIFGEQMSFDLPAPPDAEGLQYTDSSGQMMFDSSRSRADQVTWLKEELGKSGWEATTDNLVKIDFREHLIFRNPAGEMIEAAFSEFDGKTRVSLKVQTAAQVAAEAAAADKQLEKVKAETAAEQERKMNPAKISLVAPPGAKVEAELPQRIEFSTGSGKANAALAQWIAKMKSDGWESTTVVEAREAGEYELVKGDIRLNAGFMDPGFIPGSITISAGGEVQLELAK